MAGTITEVQDIRLATILTGVNVALGKKFMSHSLNPEDERCLDKLSKYIDNVEEVLRVVPYSVWFTPDYWERRRKLRCLEAIGGEDRALIQELRGLVSNIASGNLTGEYVDKYKAILGSASERLMRTTRVYDSPFDDD